MASSSVGSDVFALAALLIISLAVVLLLRYYLPIRTTPAYLFVPVFLALALPSSIILLVPIDLASSTADPSRHAIWLPEALTRVCWKVSYWLTFVLTWLLLPLLGEYVDSGFREPKDRFIYSLRSNVRYQLIALGIGLVSLVYFILQNGLHGASIKSLVMALAYAWGLFLAIYLMGHGLVAIPRHLFQNASLGGSLKRLQIHAPRLNDKLDQATGDLAALEAQLLQLQRRKQNLDLDMRDWIDDLLDTAPSLSSRARAQEHMSTAAVSNVPAVITPRYLADLSRKLKRARHKHARFQGEWQHLVSRATYFQQVIDSAGSKQLIMDHSMTSQTKTIFNMSILSPRSRYHYHTHVLPVCRIALAVIFSSMSVALVWSEVVHTFTTRISIVNLTVVRKSGATYRVDFGGQVIASIWLLYMCTAALFSLTKVKVWGNRALVRRQTYAESAAWYSLQVAKLTVPLSYNFITMLEPSVYKETAFFGFFGRYINLTPLGHEFSQNFPIFVLIPVCATLFNLYSRIRRLIGFDIIDNEETDNGFGFGSSGGGTAPSSALYGPVAAWQEGALLIQRAQQTSAAAAVAIHPSRAQGLGASGTRSPPTATYAAYTDDDAAARSVPGSGNAQSHYQSQQQQRQPQQLSSQRTTPTSSESMARYRDINPGRDDEEDNSARYFFQDLGERVRNTIDTADRPRWLQELGDSFKKPKWMAGVGGGN